MCRSDLGELVQAFASWLQHTQKAQFSTIANYLNSLISITGYCYANFEGVDDVVNLEPNHGDVSSIERLLCIAVIYLPRSARDTSQTRRDH